MKTDSRECEHTDIYAEKNKFIDTKKELGINDYRYEYLEFTCCDCDEKVYERYEYQGLFTKDEIKGDFE